MDRPSGPGPGPAKIGRTWPGPDLSQSNRMSNFRDSGSVVAHTSSNSTILAAASHTALLQSGNPYYFELYNECMRLKYELEAEKYSFFTFYCYIH